MTRKEETRRDFFKKLIIGAAAVPVIGGMSSRGAVQSAHGQEVAQKPLDENEPMAKSLGYVADAAKVDKAKWPKYDGKANCANCVLCVQAGIKINGHAGDWCRCGLFSTGLVAGPGWCNSHAPKPA